MKALVVGLMVLLLLVGTTMAAEPVKDVSYKVVEDSKSILSPILELLGIEEPTMNKSVEVFVGEQKLAVIPADSPLVDIKIHDECLAYGYGTDAFVCCEATI